MAEGHRERLRRRFVKEGLRNFEDYQALELLLFYVIPRRDVSPLARDLIQRFGSFSGVLCASVEELEKVPGIGESAAVFLHLLSELYPYYLNDLHRYKRQITDPKDLEEHLAPRFLGLGKEVVYLICLDNSNRIIYSDFISKGNVNHTSIDIRTIAEIALRVESRSIIIAHNHPHGFAIPSEQDLVTTRQLQRSLHTLGIELLDHLIFADGDYVSLQQSGKMLELNKNLY